MGGLSHPLPFKPVRACAGPDCQSRRRLLLIVSTSRLGEPPSQTPRLPRPARAFRSGESIVAASGERLAAEVHVSCADATPTATTQRSALDQRTGGQGP